VTFPSPALFHKFNKYLKAGTVSNSYMQILFLRSGCIHRSCQICVRKSIELQLIISMLFFTFRIIIRTILLSIIPYSKLYILLQYHY
jgi:hypothetical protein